MASQNGKSTSKTIITGILNIRGGCLTTSLLSQVRRSAVELYSFGLSGKAAGFKRPCEHCKTSLLKLHVGVMECIISGTLIAL